MSATQPITCRDMIEFLADYLDRELPEDQQVRFARHLAVCAPCRAYLESYRETIRLSKAAGTADDRLLEAAPDQLIAAILAARRRSNG